GPVEDGRGGYPAAAPQTKVPSRHGHERGRLPVKPCAGAHRFRCPFPVCHTSRGLPGIPDANHTELVWCLKPCAPTMSRARKCLASTALRNGREQSRGCSADHVLPKQLGGRQQPTLGRPGQPDPPDRKGVGYFHVVQRPSNHVGCSLAQGRHNCHTKPGGHETTYGWQVVAL